MRENLRKMLGNRADPAAALRGQGNFLTREQATGGVNTRRPPERIVFPPYVYKLPSGRSQDFNRNTFTTLLAAVAGTVVTPVQFAMPGSMKGYVQIMGCYVLAPDATTNITFSLNLNGAPVSGWDNIQLPPGVANFIVQNFSDLQVEVPEGNVLSVTVRNNAATGPWTVGAKMSGWYHSEADERYYWGNA